VSILRSFGLSLTFALWATGAWAQATITPERVPMVALCTELPGSVIANLAPSATYNFVNPADPALAISGNTIVIAPGGIPADRCDSTIYGTITASFTSCAVNFNFDGSDTGGCFSYANLRVK
jgi:hypothetical protein